MSTKWATNLDLNHLQLLNAAVHSASSAPASPVAGQIYYDTTLHQIGVCTNATGPVWVYLASGSGTVTSISVVSANGLAGTSSGGATPALTLSTTVTGLLKGNGTAISAATSGTDYAPATTGSSILKASSGGFANATSGTDYAPATSGTSVLKGNGAGGFSNATGSDIPNITESQVTNLTTDLAAKAPLASPTFTGTVTVPTTVNSTDAAQKAYVDAAVNGLKWLPAAVASTVGTETFTVVSGSVTVIAGTTLDGQSPAVNDYILIKDAPAATGTGSVNSTQPGNGLYIVTNATTNLTVSRATAQSGANGPAGTAVFVEGGTANGSNGYVVSVPSTNAAFTYGSGNIKWTQFSGAGELIAGTGLSKSGNTVSLQTPVTLANGGTGGSSAATARASLVVPSIYQANNGATTTTTWSITHNLNNSTPIVQVYDVTGGASAGVMVICDVTITSANALTLGFAVAMNSGQYNVTVLG